MMKIFSSFYHIEKRAREQALSHDQRKELRQQESLPILQEMEQWMKENF
jgi:hypothetical protein